VAAGANLKGSPALAGPESGQPLRGWDDWALTVIRRFHLRLVRLRAHLVGEVKVLSKST
jgi:hypothetical protein